MNSGQFVVLGSCVIGGGIHVIGIGSSVGIGSGVDIGIGLVLVLIVVLVLVWALESWTHAEWPLAASSQQWSFGQRSL